MAKLAKMAATEEELEDLYIEAKVMVDFDKESANAKLCRFQKLLGKNWGTSEWGFKAFNQAIKICYKMGRDSAMLLYYHQMLSYMKSDVTRRYGEKYIDKIIEFLSWTASNTLMKELYKTNLRALQIAPNERLKFKINLRLCKVLFDMGEYGGMNEIIQELHSYCRRETDDPAKGRQHLEVYAIEIQLCTQTKKSNKLKELHSKALSVFSAIPSPECLLALHLMGLIHECVGKMYMAARLWPEAATNFFEAFKNYEEDANTRCFQCLKYLALANMLMESEVNPFEYKETKPFKNENQVAPMIDLRAAFQKHDIIEFEKILKSNRRIILNEPFICDHIEDLLKIIKTHLLIKLIKPYTRIRIPFISKELNMEQKDVEQLLVSLIVDDRIQGRIDQINEVLVLSDRHEGMSKYTEMDKWITQLKFINQTLFDRVS